MGKNQNLKNLLDFPQKEKLKIIRKSSKPKKSMLWKIKMNPAIKTLLV